MADLWFEKQLPLSIGLRDDKTLDTFYPGANKQLMKHLKQVAQGQGELFIYLWGREGVGRTHLLQGACHWATQHGLAAMYLPLAEITKQSTPSLLEGLERIHLICLDDVHVIAGNVKWEEAIFHLFNRSRSASQRLIMAGEHTPKMLCLALADLQSRLTWGVTYQVQALQDEQMLEALQLRAKQRGLELSQDVGSFLIRRCSRSMSELYALLEQLDQASLAAQRKLTIPFVKIILKI